jgi:hypothetical protein
MTPRNVDQLRRDIDTGRANDKVHASDPAAAPLGTDDEAAGFPPQPADIAQAGTNHAPDPLKQEYSAQNPASSIVKNKTGATSKTGLNWAVVIAVGALVAVAFIAVARMNGAGA